MDEEYKQLIHKIMQTIAKEGTDALSTYDYKSNDCIVGLFNMVLHAIESSREKENITKAKAMFCEMCDMVYNRMEDMEPIDDKAD